VFGGSQPGWSGSVRQILTDESNPHLRGIFYPRANPTLPSSNQTATRTGSLRPSSLRSPTKHTVNDSIVSGRRGRAVQFLDATPYVGERTPPSMGQRPARTRATREHALEGRGTGRWARKEPRRVDPGARRRRTRQAAAGHRRSKEHVYAGGGEQCQHSAMGSFVG
jgi:hypothetical protein